MACSYNQDSLHQGDEVQVDYSCQRRIRSIHFSLRRETWSKISIQIQREMMRAQQKFSIRNRSSRNSNKTFSQISRSPKEIFWWSKNQLSVQLNNHFVNSLIWWDDLVAGNKCVFPAPMVDCQLKHLKFDTHL